jgi:transcriptional regulator with XRE-family HTH domain
MNFIGNVIIEYRSIIGMSRKELSKNICSEKYVYLIEKGERTPSAEVTRQFGNKMGIDLFKYFEYLDCLNPIDVEAVIVRFNKCRMENDPITLKKITDEALELPDFQKTPWVYEIEYNRIFYMILKENRCHEAIKALQNIIQNAEPIYSKDIYLARFYVLLSTSYQMLMDIDNARNAVLLASEIVACKMHIAQNATIVVTVKINKITLHYLTGEFDEVIEEGLLLIQYQIEMSTYELGHHGLFYLAYAYYQKGMEDEGISWFLKALYASLIRYKPMDIYYLSKYEIFQVIISDDRVSIDLVNQFKRKYDID